MRWPEHGEQRGQHDDGAADGEGHDGDARVGERPQEGEREHQQRGQREATVSALNATVRPAVWTVRTTAACGSSPRAQLLAEAGDDEEAVVDREAEAHAPWSG